MPHPFDDPREIWLRHLRWRRRILLVWVCLATVLLVVTLKPWWMPWFVKPSASPRPVVARGELAPTEQSVIELFKRSRGSVVNIATSTRTIDPWTRSALDVPQGSGTGFVWDAQGHIVTNHHVIQEATAAEAVFADHLRVRMVLVGTSPDHDLAILKPAQPTPGLAPLPLGSSHDLQVGQSVYAIGNPFGLDQTLTTGIISALDRSIEAGNGRSIEDVIQTDAAINPGNSGGPLLDSAGRLIGVNTAIYSPSGASAGIGFAIPVDTVNRVVPMLISQGRYVRPSLGITSNDRLSATILEPLGVTGVLILSVNRHSPAAVAGLRGTQVNRGQVVAGDVIQALDGKPIKDRDGLLAALDKATPGSRIVLRVWREGQVVDIPVDLPLGR